jgi:transposase
MRAFELKKKGWKQTDIAEALGVTDGAVSQWMSRAEEGEGKEALRRNVDTGPDKRLPDEDRQKLPALLEKGPEHYGFRGQVWTRGRVEKVIEREFGVSYHKTQVGRILDQIGWSLQRPAERVSERRRSHRNVAHRALGGAKKKLRTGCAMVHDM